MVRYKNRYIVVEIHVEGKSLLAPLKMKQYSLYEAVIEKIQHLHGDYGVACVKQGFMSKYCNEATRIALLKTRHDSYKILASTLPFVCKIDDKSVALHTLYTGATMRQCFKFILRHQKKRLIEVWCKLRNDQERESFEKALMDLSVLDDDISKKS